MKTKKTALVVLLASTTIIFSFVGLTPITITSLRENLLLTLFTEYEPADTLISIKYKSYYADEEATLHPASLCGWDAGFMAGAFSSALDTGYQGYESAAVRNRALTLFGADIIKGKLKLAGKDYEDKPIEIYQYSSVGVQAVFNKLYQKPTADFKGVGLQKLYNVSAKQYLRDATDIVVGIMSKKAVWDAEVKRYLQQATTKEEFYMDEFATETFTKIFSEKEMSECAPYANRMIGSMLRRGGDGSLPALILCLKTVLKDYDPEYYNAVGLKF